MLIMGLVLHHKWADAILELDILFINSTFSSMEKK
jgi:hypothetical protein